MVTPQKRTEPLSQVQTTTVTAKIGAYHALQIRVASPYATNGVLGTLTSFSPYEWWTIADFCTDPTFLFRAIRTNLVT